MFLFPIVKLYTLFFPHYNVSESFYSFFAEF